MNDFDAIFLFSNRAPSVFSVKKAMQTYARQGTYFFSLEDPEAAIQSF